MSNKNKIILLFLSLIILFYKHIYADYGPTIIEGVTGYATESFELHAGEGNASFEVSCNDTSDYDLFLYDEWQNLLDYSENYGDDLLIYNISDQGTYFIEVYLSSGSGMFELDATYQEYLYGYNDYWLNNILTTPNGSDIEVIDTEELVIEHLNYETYWMDYAFDNLYYFNTVISYSATRTYNCHAFAWYMEGNQYESPYWLNPDQISTYIADSSYNEVTQYDNYQIILYINDSNIVHSAIKVDFDFESKWGQGYLWGHPYDEVPYSYDDIKYYGNAATAISENQRNNLFCLYNSPNPFNPTTTISYSLAESINNPQIEIYNTKGQKVRNFNLENSSGENSIFWDGRDANNKLVSSGVYFYRLVNEGKTVQSRKMLMLK